MKAQEIAAQLREVGIEAYTDTQGNGTQLFATVPEAMLEKLQEVMHEWNFCKSDNGYWLDNSPYGGFMGGVEFNVENGLDMFEPNLEHPDWAE